MKLKELFDKYTFDDIVPYLREIINDNPDSLPDFRMAFDELRMMKPSDENSEDVLIKDFLDKDGNLLANPVCWHLGYSWDECLAKRVVIDNDYPLDDRYVLAGCLWEMTFYGFSSMPDDEAEISFSIPKEPKNKYDKALYRLQLSHWKHTTPRRYRWKGHPLCTDIDYQERENKNRSKRKRDYRVECREKYLEMHSQRENFILKLTRCGICIRWMRASIFLIHLALGMSVSVSTIFWNLSISTKMWISRNSMMRLSACVHLRSIL